MNCQKNISVLACTKKLHFPQPKKKSNLKLHKYYNLTDNLDTNELATKNHFYIPILKFATKRGDLCIHLTFVQSATFIYSQYF